MQKRSKVFKGHMDLMDAVRKHYPNAQPVPVCMGNTVSNIYEDKTMEKQVAEVLYHYSASAGMFGYDYKLVYL
jgi:hypothetical protein